ncbi:MAG TPA: phosphoribosylanthranilate isomerase [Gammaproteobacteria bacterium]|nr:phosphoribosylanthranilate isomerase [Gammaproteobacteria bacterium]
MTHGSQHNDLSSKRLLTRIKICGMTCQQDAENAITAGVDALGFIFWPPSKRYIAIDEAAKIVDQVSAYVTTVAVFVDPTEADVDAVLADVAIDSLQFHGQEPASFCNRFARPFVKALAMHEDQDVFSFCMQYHQASAVLLDTYRAGTPGGTGEQFTWRWIPEHLPLPVILAGGLAPENIAEAVRSVRPYAVDISSGVESSPGCKDTEKLQALVRAVHCADMGRQGTGENS